jgi:hypothetical protein
MIRNPMFDWIAGASFALGGPMAFMLPQRIFLEMMTAGWSGTAATPEPARKTERTAV